jgi:hypothetical protein
MAGSTGNNAQSVFRLLRVQPFKPCFPFLNPKALRACDGHFQQASDGADVLKRGVFVVSLGHR